MEPITSTGRVTPLATLTRILGLLRDAVGREVAAIAARRACRAAVNECNSRAAAYGGSRPPQRRCMRE
eukprot:2645576-Pleurochrysis_carterae.AAC.1